MEIGVSLTTKELEVRKSISDLRTQPQCGEIPPEGPAVAYPMIAIRPHGKLDPKD
jgi:hypothetical protein